MSFIYTRLINDVQIKTSETKSIEGPKFQKVGPNTAKVFCAWDKRIVIFIQFVIEKDILFFIKFLKNLCLLYKCLSLTTEYVLMQDDIGWCQSLLLCLTLQSSKQAD